MLAPIEPEVPVPLPETAPAIQPIAVSSHPELDQGMTSIDVQHGYVQPEVFEHVAQQPEASTAHEPEISTAPEPESTAPGEIEVAIPGDPGPPAYVAPPQEAARSRATISARELKVAPAVNGLRSHQSAGFEPAEWVAEAAQRGATTLYLRAGQPPAIRIHERLEPLTYEPLDPALFAGLTTSSGLGRDGWRQGNAGDWIREYDDVGQVSCFVFQDNVGPGLVIHLSPQHSAAALQKHVPRQVRRVCEGDDGLVVVSAPAEADVLSMLAVVAELSARKRSGYMIALEPPNGLGYGLAGSFVSERKINGAGEEFAAAIRQAVQERPDILVIAPRESSIAAEEAIRAAGPGRLVILGILASTAPRAVESLLSFVSTDREPQLRRILAGSYRVGFSYRALRRRGGGRAIVEDVLVGTSEIRTRLERSDFAGIEKLQRSGADGMRTMDGALARAASRGDISVRQAASHASDRSELIALTRKLARQRRAAVREHADADRLPGSLRAITIA